jgi:predicted ArsR family transcriptional regulator
LVVKRAVVQRIEVLATLLEPTRRRLYDYVTGEATAVSRDQAGAAVGVTRAMAAFHLDKLVESGLLRAEYRRLGGRAGRGAGRPSKLYRRTRRRIDVTVPPRDHELLARVLSESMDPDRAARPPGEVAAAYGRALGTRARERLATRSDPDRMLRCVRDVMGEIGFEPVVIDPTETRARNCPFDPLSRQSPAVVCGIGIALLGGVVDGLEASHVLVERHPEPDLCCVVLRSSGAGAR